MSDGPRKTTHGVLCKKCGSSQVFIDTTRTRECDPGDKDRVMVKRQYCRCGVCGHRWDRRLCVTEKVLS